METARGRFELQTAPVPNFGPELGLVQLLSLVDVTAHVEAGSHELLPGKFLLGFEPAQGYGGALLRVLVLRYGAARADILGNTLRAVLGRTTAETLAQVYELTGERGIEVLARRCIMGARSAP